MLSILLVDDEPAVREALRRLSLYLSKKGSMEAVQRKMGIYSKYLPLIAKFSQELAGEKRPPKYKQLIRDEQEAVDAEEIAAQELTVDAALSGNRTTVLEAMLADQMVSHLPYQGVVAMTDELLVATAPWLPTFAAAG